MPKHVLTDDQIGALLAERKPIAPREVNRLKKRLRQKPNNTRYKTADIHVRGDSGRVFHIVATQHVSNKLKFSVRLAIYWRRHWVNLIRCNGHHGPHPNTLELGTSLWQVPANTMHIHQATARYQLAEMQAERFARPTDGYSSLEGAVEYLCTHFGCCNAESPRQRLLSIMD